MSSLGRRLLTSSILIPLALAVVFFAPGDLAFVVFFGIFFMAAVEFLAMARPSAPSAPLGSLLVLIPLAAAGGFLAIRGGAHAVSGWWLAGAMSLLVAVAGCVTLLGRTEVREGLVSMGILTFAVPYFAVPPLGLYWLQDSDPWLLIALLAIVWLGDTAAFAVGRAIGRRKLAPTVSPNKTWEGAIAGFVTALLASGIWSLVRLDELRPGLLAVAALTAVAAQLGDLVESVIKRGAGLKDSSNLLPGHGGFFDRIDAMTLATPVFVAGLHALGLETLMPR